MSIPYLGGACGEGVEGCEDWKEAGTLGVATGVSLNPRGRCPPNPTACKSGVSPGVSGLSSTSFCHNLSLCFVYKILKYTYSHSLRNFRSAQCEVLPARYPIRLFHPSAPRDYIDIHLFCPRHDLLEYPFLTLQFWPF